MIYEGIDRWNSPSIQHGFKYLKKIEIGGHTRYFYTPEALAAYYRADKKVANASRDVANAKINAYTTAVNIRSNQHEREMNNNVAGALQAYNYARAAVQPVARTARLAATSALGSKSKGTLAKRSAKSLIKRRGMMTVGKLLKRISVNY